MKLKTEQHILGSTNTNLKLTSVPTRKPNNSSRLCYREGWEIPFLARCQSQSLPFGNGRGQQQLPRRSHSRPSGHPSTTPTQGQQSQGNYQLIPPIDMLSKTRWDRLQPSCHTFSHPKSLGHTQTSSLVWKPVLKKFSGIPCVAPLKFSSLLLDPCPKIP